MIDLVSQASYELGRAFAVMDGTERSVHLRRENRIRTVHSSLAIEHNTLTLGQVTAILEGKRVLGDPREIREVQNAFAAYDLLTSIDPFSVDELLRAHELMMDGLVSEAGCFRSGGVGVFDGDRLIHMAPPARLVPDHIANLFVWYLDSPLHPLIKSAVFHYEFEFIHPFQDGNGRMGRMWHTALLGAWNPLFFWLPVEELIQKNQQGYYDALGAADAQADSSEFVVFMLRLFVAALKEAGDSSAPTEDPTKSEVFFDVADLVSDTGTGSALKCNDLAEKRDDSRGKSLNFVDDKCIVDSDNDIYGSDKYPLSSDKAGNESDKESIRSDMNPQKAVKGIAGSDNSSLVLSDVEVRALRIVSERKEVKSAEIAKAIGMTQRGAAKLLGRLTAKGLIEACGANKNRRYRLLSGRTQRSGEEPSDGR